MGDSVRIQTLWERDTQRFIEAWPAIARAMSKGITMRADGFYWVRHSGLLWTGEVSPELAAWRVAEWLSGMWWLCGSSSQEKDDYWAEIDERRIERT